LPFLPLIIEISEEAKTLNNDIKSTLFRQQITNGEVNQGDLFKISLILGREFSIIPNKIDY
jgi:hypothetical protein